MARTGTRASGYHQVDAAYEHSFEMYSRELKLVPNRDRARRACGCVQNLTLTARCINCPAVEAGDR